MSGRESLNDARDPIDVAEDFVRDAVIGVGPWETRTDATDPSLCWVERGVGTNRVRFVETPLTYLEACKIERLLEVARAKDWAPSSGCDCWLCQPSDKRTPPKERP
jgi:hypothetical protein